MSYGSDLLKGIIFFVVIVIIATSLVFGAIFLVSFGPIYNEGYKKGQIDALTGNVKYVLIEKETKEKVWMEKKE